MLNGQVFSDQLFESHIFALFINTFVDGHNGIAEHYKNGMEVSYSGSNVTIDTGAVLVQGRYLEEDAGTTIDAGTSANFCKLVITINLDLVNTESNFNQGKYEILTDPSDYPTLTQQDIVNTNSGIYQYELAQFKTTSGGITDFVDKRTFLDIDALYTALQNQYATSIGDLSELDTTDQSNLVGAINEVNTKVEDNKITSTTLPVVIDTEGRVIKMPDGTMIQSKMVSISTTINTASGSIYTSDFVSLGNWGEPFVNVPVMSINIVRTVSGGAGNHAGIYYTRYAGVSNIGEVKLWKYESTGTATNTYYIHVIGVGKWS